MSIHEIEKNHKSFTLCNFRFSSFESDWAISSVPLEIQWHADCSRARACSNIHNSFSTGSILNIDSCIPGTNDVSGNNFPDRRGTTIFYSSP